jgi:hypothetical protein
VVNEALVKGSDRQLQLPFNILSNDSNNAVASDAAFIIAIRCATLRIAFCQLHPPLFLPAALASQSSVASCAHSSRTPRPISTSQISTIALKRAVRHCEALQNLILHRERFLPIAVTLSRLLRHLQPPQPADKRRPSTGLEVHREAASLEPS